MAVGPIVEFALDLLFDVATSVDSGSSADRGWSIGVSRVRKFLIWLWLFAGPLIFGCPEQQFPLWLAATMTAGFILWGLTWLVNGARAIGHLLLSGIVLAVWYFHHDRMFGETPTFLLINALLLTVSGIRIAFAQPRRWQP